MNPRLVARAHIGDTWVYSHRTKKKKTPRFQHQEKRSLLRKMARDEVEP